MTASKQRRLHPLGSVYLIPILNTLLKLKEELWSGENWPWPHSLSEAICYGLEWILTVNPHAVSSREKATGPIDAYHTETYSLRIRLRPCTAALYPVGDCRGRAAEFSTQIGFTGLRTVYMGAFLAITTYEIHLTESLPMCSIKKSRGVLRLGTKLPPFHIRIGSARTPETRRDREESRGSADSEAERVWKLGAFSKPPPCS
ncbi:hypothetical protein VNO77_08375 [Canavalia gladiata]|uniref:Uncharacterized protein n=1 Tax=Canavalia gladiata TaxID=3824 RepID=A0AAN9QW67_CANGL